MRRFLMWASRILAILFGGMAILMALALLVGLVEPSIVEGFAASFADNGANNGIAQLMVAIGLFAAVAILFFQLAQLLASGGGPDLFSKANVRRLDIVIGALVVAGLLTNVDNVLAGRLVDGFLLASDAWAFLFFAVVIRTIVADGVKMADDQKLTI